MMKLVRYGAFLSVIGFIIIAISGIIFSNILMVAIGLCVCCIGLGLQLGTMFRVIGKLEVKSQSMLFSLMAFIQVLLMTIFLEISNYILNLFDYSLTSFVIAVIIFGVLGFTLVSKFISMNKNRNWQ